MAGTYHPARSGAEAEAIVIARVLAAHGDVSLPFVANTAYDLITDLGGAIQRVQVKRAWYEERKQAYTVELRRKHSTLPPKYDFLVVVAGTTCYVLPQSTVEGCASLSLRPEGCKQRAEKQSGRRPHVDAIENYRERWDLLAKEDSRGWQ